jgi:selenocysteine-specific elongation factor
LQQQLITILTDFHQQQPLRQGMPREQMRSQLALKQTTFSALLEHNGEIVSQANLLRLATYSVHFTPMQQAAVDRLQEILQATPYAPPTTAEAVAVTGEGVFNALLEAGEIVHVQPEVIFSRTAYDDMVGFILNYLDQHGSISASELRDHFQTTRKYAIGLLEYLDSIKVTRREGDVRVRGPNAG